MREVAVTSPEELNALVSDIMGEGAWMSDFNKTKEVLLRFPMVVGSADAVGGHGWYSAPPEEGPIECRSWHVKAATLEWAICAGALAINGIQVSYCGVPPTLPDIV